MRVLVSIIVLATLFSCSWASTDSLFKHVTQQVAQTYQGPNGVQMSFQITMASLEDPSLRETTTGVMALKGASRYLEMDQVVYLSNPTYTAFVDHESKLIAVDSTITSNLPNVDLASLSLDSISKLFSHGTIQQLASGNFLVTEKNRGVIHHSEVEIDSAAFYIKRIKITYQQPGDNKPIEFLEAVYSNHKPADSSLFSIAPFFDHENGKLSPTKKYQDYEQL